MGNQKLETRISLLTIRLGNMTDGELYEEHQRFSSVVRTLYHYLEFMSDEEYAKIMLVYNTIANACRERGIIRG